MKKNIVIVILVLIITSFMIYSKIKADEAMRMAQKAVEYQTKAEKASLLAKQQQQLALERAAEARMAQAEAERALKECNAN